MVLWKPFRDLLPLPLLGLGWNLIFFSRILHGFFSATLIASIIGHFYFALFTKKLAGGQIHGHRPHFPPGVSDLSSSCGIGGSASPSLGFFLLSDFNLLLRISFGC
jgi:hypothetical protein